MESSRKFFPAIVVLLLLVIATEMAPAQARECETESSKFSGMCMIQANCDHICKTEGFMGGDCRGFRRRCMCRTQC
uniref:Knottins-like domain-containing protein n=1 Tax=Oryza meridionalis TaxID=40149 RepID=A0A0E0DB30_9ORYZ